MENDEIIETIVSIKSPILIISLLFSAMFAWNGEIPLLTSHSNTFVLVSCLLAILVLLVTDLDVLGLMYTPQSTPVTPDPLKIIQSNNPTVSTSFSNYKANQQLTQEEPRPNYSKEQINKIITKNENMKKSKDNELFDGFE